MTNKKESSEIMTLFTEFTLSLMNEFLETQLDFTETDKNQETSSKDSRKEVLSAENRRIFKNCLILQYIKLQKLYSTAVNLNKAYLQLKSLEFQLKKLKLLSMVESGILTSLKHSIVEQKEIVMMIDSTNSNKFCIKYFNCQKVSHKLQELIIKAVSEVKLFWTEVKVREPDDEKILVILETFRKIHTKIMEIYENVVSGLEKESTEVRIMFMFYGKVLELEGDHRFFAGHSIREEKENNFKNAASTNIQMYSEDANSHVMSFSIGEETFGQLKYRSCGVSTFIDPSFNTISHFLPKDF